MGGRGSLKAESRVWKPKATMAVKILNYSERTSRAKDESSPKSRETLNRWDQIERV